MTIKLVGWQLDTCSCYHVEQYDDTDPTRTKTLFEVKNKCPAHTPIPDSSIYQVVREENSRWARTPAALVENGPSTLYDIQTDGSRQLKPNIFVNWSWSGTAPNRIMTITVTGITLTTNQKTTIQNTLNTKFGTGKVLIA